MELPSTRWTVLAAASLHGDLFAGKALEVFCSQYRPLVVGMLRHRGVPPDRIEDLAHDFMLQLMRSSALQRADPQSGRFRSFLSGALVQFLADDADRHRAAKRGSGIAPLGLEAVRTETAQLESDQAETFLLLDREWALHIFVRAIESVRRQWHSPEKADRFAVLRSFLPGAAESISQQEAASRLGLSDDAFRKELQRLRDAVRTAIRSEVAATVACPDEITEEMSHLMRVLQNAPVESSNFLAQPGRDS